MEATRVTLAAARGPAKHRLRLLLCAMMALAITSGLQGPISHGPVPLSHVKPAGFTSSTLPNGGSTSSWCVNGQTPLTACGTANEAFNVFGCDWYAGAGPGWDSGWSTDGDYATTDGHGCNQESSGASDLGSDYYTENPDRGNYSNDGDGDGNSCCGDGDGRYDNSGNPETPPGDSGDISIQDGDNCCDALDDIPGWPDYNDTTFDTGYDCSATEGCDTDYDDFTGCETTPGDGCDGPGQYDAGGHWGGGAGADECGGCDTDGDVGNDGNGTDNDRWWATSYFNDAGCPVGPEYYQCALVGERAGAYVGATYNAAIFGSFSYYSGLEHVLDPVTGRDQYLYCVDPGHALTTGVFDRELGYYNGAPNLPAISASNKNQIWYIAEFYGASQHGGTFSPGIPGGAVEMYAAAQARIWALATNSSVTGFWAAGGYSVVSANSWYTTIMNNAANAVASGYAPYQGAGFAPYAASPSNAQYYFDTPTSGSGLPNPPGQIIAGGTSTINYHSVFPNGLGQSGQGAWLYITPAGAAGATWSGAFVGFPAGSCPVGGAAAFACVHVTTNASGTATETLNAPLPGPAPTYQTNVVGISDNTNVVNPGFMIGNAAAGNNAQYQIEAAAAPHDDIQNVQIDPPLFVFPPANPTFSETLHDNGTSALIPGGFTTLTQPVAPVTAVLAGNATPGQRVYWDMNYGNNGVFSTIIPGTIQDCFGAAYNLSISSGVCSVAGSPYASGSFQLDNGSALTGTNCGGVTAPIAPPVASWCTNILPNGTNQSDRVTATIPLTWDSPLSTELPPLPNAHAVCNFPYYHYGYTNNGSLPGSMPVNQEVCAAGMYTTNLTSTKTANTPCASLGTVASWSQFMTVGLAAAANNPPVSGDQACGGVTNLNTSPTPIVYTVTVNNLGPATRNLNGFTVTDNLTGNLAFLFGVGITCNAGNPKCTGATAFVPATQLGGENFPSPAIAAPSAQCAAASDWCYLIKGTVSGPVASNCGGGLPPGQCWLYADFNPISRALVINCVDNPPSVYSCDVPAGDHMDIALNSFLVYKYDYTLSPNPPNALASPAYTDYQPNSVNYGFAPCCVTTVSILPGSSDAPGTSAVNLNNSVTVTAPDAAVAVASNTATTQAFLQCPQPLPGITFANYPRLVFSNQTVNVTVDITNWYRDSLAGLYTQQGDPSIGMLHAGAEITAPVDGNFANWSISGLSPGSGANVDVSSTGRVLNINLTSMAAAPVAGIPYNDVLVSFNIVFGVIPVGTLSETSSAYVTVFDTMFPSCGYPAVGGIAPIAGNSSTAEDPGDPGIVGTAQSTSTGFVGIPPPSE